LHDSPRTESTSGQANNDPQTGSRSHAHKYWAVLALLIAAGVLWYFLGRSHAPPENNAPAPVSVTVETVKEKRMRLWNDFSGRLRSVDSAVIRPEVSGRIKEVRFQDGQSVHAGDVLFVIDPRTYESAAARAGARIASARASLEYATANYTRNISVTEKGAVSQLEIERSKSVMDAAAAELLAAQADLKTAQVDVDHAYLKAPISGRLSRAELTVGNLVQSGPNAPVLTSIVSENEIYVDFEVDEQTYLETIRNAASGNAEENTIPVELVAPDDGGRTNRGFIQNFDNRLDISSGTIRARAKFTNTDRTLVPGMFVSVHLASSQERNELLIPDRAIGFDQTKQFVFVAGPDNKVQYREVKLGAGLGGRRVVLNGLNAGDRLIVDGTMRVHPDALVNPHEFDSNDKTGNDSGPAPVKEASIR